MYPTIDSSTFAELVDTQYDISRISFLRGPDYSYNLDTSILRANRQIRGEALDLFEEEFTFVSIIHDTYDHCPLYSATNGLRDYGVAVVAEGKRARAFPMIAMSIDLDIWNAPPTRDGGSLAEREVSVFTLEDLPLACVYLQHKMPVYNHSFRKAQIHISIDTRIADISAAGNDTRPAAKSKLGRCIDAVSRIRGAWLVKIDGPISPSCEVDTESTMCRNRLTAKETMNMLEALCDCGDKAWMKDDLESAIAEYKKALCVIRASDIYGEYYETINGGRFHGLVVGFACVEAKVRLHTLIAECFLQSKQYRLARKYVDMAYRPIHSYGILFDRLRSPLELPNNSNPFVYAKLLLVAAQISLACNNEGKAVRELGEASKYDPGNQEIQTLLQQCSVNLQKRKRRREVTLWQQRASLEQKFHAALEVVNGRIARGDEAVLEANYTRAREKYEAAYTKIQPLNCPVGAVHYPHFDQYSKELTMEVLAKLITICFLLDDDDAVHFWASTLKTHVPRFLREHRFGEWWRVLYAVEAFYAAYLSKAVVFQKSGQPIEAIRYYQRALVCDPSCDVAYSQLAALKKNQKCEEMKPFNGSTTIDYTLHPLMETCGFFFSPDVDW